MNKKKAVSALSAVFPTPETFRCFNACAENAKKAECFAQYAYSCGAIEDNTLKSLEMFIRRNALHSKECAAPQYLTFEKLIEHRKSLFDFKKSVSALIYEINKEIQRYIPAMPTISKCMFTRLRQGHKMTAHKENILRCFAFWLGLKRPGFRWNYEKLFKICPQDDKEIVLNCSATRMTEWDISLFLTALRTSLRHLEQAIEIAEKIQQNELGSGVLY
jgi:hypothetical protein